MTTKAYMDEETQAIARLKHGDPQGLEVLVRRYYHRAARAAFLILHDPAQAEDIVQETFLRLVNTAGQYDSTRPFSPWFLRSVVNAALNRARNEKRSVPLEEESSTSLEIDLERLVEAQSGPEEIVEANEFRRQVWQALEQLEPAQRAVIVMRYYLEMSEAEMSDEMDSPSSSIKWWLRSARLRLRCLLDTLHPDNDNPRSNPRGVSRDDRS